MRKSRKEIQETSGNPRYKAPALEKGLEILELLSKNEEGLTQASIARELDRSSSEIYRMLAVLENMQYIRKEAESGLYRLTLKIFMLGQRCDPVRVLRDASRQSMAGLSQRLKVECHLTVLEEGQLVVVHSQPSPGPLRLEMARGSSHSPIHTVSGRLLLSRLSAEERDRHLRLGRKQFPEHSVKKAAIPDWERLAATETEETRDEKLVGVFDLATVLFLPGGPMAALAITGFHTGLKRSDKPLLRQELVFTAQEISQNAGV